MLLTGTYTRTLDDKGRLVLPKRAREVMSDPAILFVTPGPEQCLWLYTEAELERQSSRFDQAADAEARVFRRLYFAQTEAVDLDKTGRMLVPERLLRFAGLKKEVVLIGVRDHLELWDAVKWTRYADENAARFDSVAEKSFGRDPSASV